MAIRTKSTRLKTKETFAMFLSTLVKPCEFSLWGLRYLWAFKFLVGFFPQYSGDFLHLQLWIDEKTALGFFFSKCSIQYWVKYRLSLTSKGGGIGCPLDAFKCRIYRSGSRVDITKFNFEHKVFQKYSIQQPPFHCCCWMLMQHKDWLEHFKLYWK